jgi:predicted nuclease with RNAse H fold
MIVCGIDLASSERNASGVCVMEDSKIKTFLVYRDEQIVEIVERAKPSIVAIDSPLNFSEKPFRECEEELQRLGYKLLPLNLPQMKELTKRAIGLKYKLEKFTEVIECHPTTTRKILGMKNVREVEAKLGMKLMNLIKSEHEVDAIFAALTAFYYLKGEYKEWGNKEEGVIITPYCDLWNR